MSLILHIDTAVETGSICLSRQGGLLKFRSNENQKDHAAWMHKAIDEMIIEAGCTMKELKAVAVSNGPGSYTGLRIGLSAAKGICFALGIPLITIGTLEIMATAAINQVPVGVLGKTYWLCPMIDARRMEVFFAVYDTNLTKIIEPRSALVDSDIFAELPGKKKILFFGNGSCKLKNNLVHENAIFADSVQHSAIDMISLSFQYYQHKKFADLAYTEPLYMKEFYSPVQK